MATRTSPTPASGSPAASCSCTPTPRGERPALLAVGLQRRRRAVAAVRHRRAATTHDLDLVSLDPMGARAALVWNVDGRSEIELLDLRSGHHRAPPLPARRRRHRCGLHPRRARAADRERGADRPADDHPDRRSTPLTIPSRPLLPAAPRDAGHLVDPVLHHFPGRRTGCRSRAGCSARRGAFGSRSDPHLAARRPGGPGTPDLPAAVPGAARRGRRGLRAERARLGRLRPHASPRPTTWNAGSSRSLTCAAAVTSLVEQRAGRPGADRRVAAAPTAAT